ncbi:LiaF domain-containing protein [Pedobacter sp. ASV28]|uniref:LiaF transmembrane domain-containing protein n=1 Tax=Pedobacter sp. ASV28 TaxID=2795123 RepID=UPI0018EB2342|nr:LiaF domain-containing protein [Pedobacter sp. ASV28]
MENINKKEMINRSGKVWAGLFIIGIGSLLLLNNFGLHLPHWIFKWSTLLIAIGLFVGARHNFRNSGWFIMVLIGSYFTLRDIFRDYDMSNIVLPLMLVVLGLYLILKPKGTNNFHKERWKRRNDRFNRRFERLDSFSSPNPNEPAAPNHDKTYSNHDYIDSVNVFGGSQQTIFSKNLKGGEITAIFGGGDLNLTQADFQGEIVIDVTAIFGGLKVIIPPTWQIKSEVTAIFGGVDDKRAIQPIEQDQNKLVILRGVVLFGGVEIKNY